METKTKRVIQRNLNLQAKYSFVRSFYSSIEAGGGWCCENCNKPISNIAEVKDENGKTYLIGMDCAEALTMKDKLGFEFEAKPAFTLAKGIRAKILNGMKKHQGYFVTMTEKPDYILLEFGKPAFRKAFDYHKPDGTIVSYPDTHYTEPMGWERVSRDIWESHCYPMLTGLYTRLN